MKILSEIKKKSLFRFVFYLVLAVIPFTIFFLAFGYKPNDILNKNCTVNYVEDIMDGGKCADSKDMYLNFKTQSVIEESFSIYKNVESNVVAKMVSIVLPYSEEYPDSTYIMIGLVPNNDVEDLVKKTENSDEYVTIRAKYVTFTESKYTKGVNYIIDYYKKYVTSDEYKGEATEEDIENLFLDVNFNSYDDSVFTMYIALVIVAGITIILLVLAITALIQFLNPNKNKSLKSLTEDEIEKADNEYASGNFSYQNKRFKISDNFFFITEAMRYYVGKISDVAWVYERKYTQRSSVSYYLRINLRNGKYEEVSMTQTEVDLAVEAFGKADKHIEMGFSDEASKEYKSNPESMGK